MNGPLPSAASNKGLSMAGSGLPDVSAAINGILQPMNIGIVQTQMIDGYTQETILNRSTQGSIQPMAEDLAIRKEGDRSWRWWVIHITPDITLQTNDVIVVAGVKYRIMQRTDWAKYGYREYHAIEAYVPETQP